MEERRRRRGKQGRRKSKEFMDAALDAYIRHLALAQWRDVTDLQETLGVDVLQAVCEAGSFPQRGAYRDIWERWWQNEVIAHAAEQTLSLFGGIEAAVRGALRQEIDARQQHSDVTIEDTPAYKAFLDHALDRLFEEEAGSLEEL